MSSAGATLNQSQLATLRWRLKAIAEVKFRKIGSGGLGDEEGEVIGLAGAAEFLDGIEDAGEKFVAGGVVYGAAVPCL